MQNGPRAKKLKELKMDAKKLHKDVLWDGRPHSSFKSWTFVEDNEINDDINNIDNPNESNDNTQNDNIVLLDLKTGKRKREAFEDDGKKVKRE